MKTFLMLLCLAVLLPSCEKAVDVPSLQEEMDGVWKIEFYVEERYDATLNSVNRDTTYCGNSGFMNFTRNGQVLVNFDSIPRLVWKYSIVDQRTLDIEGRKWTIEKPDDQQLHLLSNERDTSLKQRNVMRYQLKRP
jgi:hypothetical protein